MIHANNTPPNLSAFNALLMQILRSSQNAESASAAAAQSSQKAANNTRFKISWLQAAVISVVLVVFVFPICRKLEVPYVAPVLDSFIEWSQNTGRETGILLAKTVVYRQSEQTRLNGIHPDLLQVFHLANEYAHQDGIHIHIREGMRTVKRQAVLFRSGFSSTMNSRHLDGHALDLGYQYEGPQSNSRDWYYARIINKYMQKSAKELGIRIEWGGYWKSFPDGFHWQLPWETHNKGKSSAPHKKKIIVQPKRQSGLSAANSERLLKAIIQRESSNDHSKENPLSGMLGLCQFSAATLVEIGLIHRSQYDAKKQQLMKPGKNGKYARLDYAAHKAFLADTDNWILKGGKQAFMSSRSVQLKACNELLKLHTHYGKSAGAIDGNSSQRRIAGYLFAAQFGHVRANDYYLRGEDSRDGSKVLTSHYAELGESVIKD